jgi:hypothetical protein
VSTVELVATPVSVNSCEHAVLVALPEVVHPFSRFASDPIFATGAVPVVGKPGPGIVPVVTFTRFATVAAAAAIPAPFVAVAPRYSPAINCDIAHAVATVVASFTVKLDPFTTELHVPRIDASAIAPFVVPPDPAFPPFATTYNTELLSGHVNPPAT